MLAPFSTGHFPRSCRVCGTSFVGLGILCPTHLAPHARQRAFEIQAARKQSHQIIAACESRAQASRPPRTEIPDELDTA